jgi:CBS domain-containing protein
MGLKVIPDVVSGQTIRSLAPGASALEAARLMRDHDISSVVVLDAAGKLVGIVTERDMARRVVAEDRQAGALRVQDVMTADPVVVGPDASAFDALEAMRKQRVRHVPVVEGGKVVGMVSMRDLRQAISSAGGNKRGTALGRLRALFQL